MTGIIDLVFHLNLIVNNVPTVSDTKRAFYAIHARPVNSVYRRVVEELLVEMHLLNVNEEFRYDFLFALGVTTTFDRFMEGYEPQPDQISIFKALCQAQGMDPEQLQRDSQRLRELVQSMSGSEMMAWISAAAQSGGDELQGQFQAIAQNPKFKYSRLFAIGLYTLLELADPTLVKAETQLTETLQHLGSALKLSESKFQKDLELYRNNLDKMNQARQTMADIVKASRSLQQKREAERQAKTDAQNSQEANSEELPASQDPDVKDDSEAHPDGSQS